MFFLLRQELEQQQYLRNQTDVHEETLHSVSTPTALSAFYIHTFHTDHIAFLSYSVSHNTEYEDSFPSLKMQDDLDWMLQVQIL